MARPGLQWDGNLSAEHFGPYKPDPKVYDDAALLLDLPAERVTLVAAHPSDLRARTAGWPPATYRGRSLGPGGPMQEASDAAFEVVAADFVILADTLDT